jgi:hypothetical protein
LVEVDAADDLLGEDLEDQNRTKEGNGPNGQHNMDTDGRTGNLPKANLDSQGGGTTHQSG